jgi:hypothetical protein
VLAVCKKAGTKPAWPSHGTDMADNEGDNEAAEFALSDEFILLLKREREMKTRGVRACLLLICFSVFFNSLW